MNLKNIILCLTVLFLIIITSGAVFADEAPAMTLVEDGTVSGDVVIHASNPFTSSSGSLEYTIPDDVSEIRSANVIVSSYSGSGAPTYALYSNITLDTKNGLEVLGYEDLHCDISMTNDPAVYIINNHTTKQFSDYQSSYNITDKVKDLSGGDTIKITVKNTKQPDYQFDGRIKMIALVFAYDDGDEDNITYWLNVGQSWTQSSRSNLIKTKDFSGEYDEVTFENIATSSNNALCRINNKLIYDPIYEKQGSYFIDDIWNITDNFEAGIDTNFSYKASDSGYGSFKSVVQLLKAYKLNNTQTIVVDAADVVKYFKGDERFVVNVKDYDGNPIANKTVNITLNGVTYTRTTDVNGTASMALNLNSGQYNVTTVVDNIKTESTVTVLSTVNGTDVVKVFRNATQYYATFRDSEGNYLANGTGVIFNINGVMYMRYINGSEGRARLNLNLEQGEYIITAINPITDENAANNITVLSKIINNNNLVKYYRNDSQYYVQIIGDDGKPVGANETVTFNINGVMYERKTNASGVARLNINLQPGEYIITAMYGGCSVANNITVLPVLSAENITMSYKDGTKFKASLVDGEGKPLTNTNITFNINGVFYERLTDTNGVASLNINLMPGEYIITSSYNGSNIANTIKING